MNNLQANEEPFDFSKYRVKNEALPTELPSQQGTSDEPFDFSKYRVKEPPTGLQEVSRHVARTGSRIAETITGFPGDVINFARFVGENLPEPPQVLQREPSFIQKAGKKALESVPSSDDLKKMTSYLTSGFTDPQNALEELGDDVTSLATILINPSKAVQSFPKFLKTIGTSVGKAIGVKGAGKGAELLGSDESTKNKVELGTLFLTGLIGGKTAGKFISEKYEKARSLIPQGTMVNTGRLATSLDAVDKELAKGISTNTKNEVRSALNELKAKASGGAMEANEIVESYHNINERLTSKKLFDELTSTEKKQLKSRYDLVKNEIGKEIAEYGKSNPEFYKTWQQANEGYGAIAQSKKVSNFIQSKAGKLPHHLIGSIAIDLFLGKPAAVVGVPASYALIKSGELLYRIAKSPILRNHYMKVLMEAGNENLPGMIKHLDALDKEAKKIKVQ